jgi:hypothetical protein
MTYINHSVTFTSLFIFSLLNGAPVDNNAIELLMEIIGWVTIVVIVLDVCAKLILTIIGMASITVKMVTELVSKYKAKDRVEQTREVINKLAN